MAHIDSFASYNEEASPFVFVWTESVIHQKWMKPYFRDLAILGLGGRRRHALAAVRSGPNKPHPSFRADR